MDKINSIVWGPPGVGKTPFCGTLEAYEKTSPCLILDVDHGTLSLDTSPIPTVYTVNKFDDVSRIYSLLAKKDWAGLAKLTGTELKEYRSVVIDSGTELISILLHEIVSEDDKNSGVPDQASYFRSQLRFTTMWKAFRDLPMTCVMTAGDKDQKDDVSGVIRLFPEFSPGLLHELLRHTDLILFMDVIPRKEEYTHYIRTQPTNRFTARDRSGKLSAMIEGDKLYWGDLLKKVLS